MRTLTTGVDVAAIAAAFGGGGHPKAAGVQINGGADRTRRVLCVLPPTWPPPRPAPSDSTHAARPIPRSLDRRQTGRMDKSRRRWAHPQIARATIGRSCRHARSGGDRCASDRRWLGASGARIPLRRFEILSRRNHAWTFDRCAGYRGPLTQTLRHSHTRRIGAS